MKQMNSENLALKYAMVSGFTVLAGALMLCFYRKRCTKSGLEDNTVDCDNFVRAQ